MLCFIFPPALVLDDYRTNGKKTLRDVEHRINRHLSPFFGGKRAKDISAADVQAFIAKRQSADASNGEINRELTLLRRAYNLGLQAELAVKKPAIRMLKEPPARQGFFEQNEYESLLAKLPDYLRPPITFAYWTGWRIYSEILPLTWSQVDLEEGTVRLLAGETKNDEGAWSCYQQNSDRCWTASGQSTPPCTRAAGWSSIATDNRSRRFATHGIVPATKPGWSARSPTTSDAPPRGTSSGPAFPSA
jgi:integrase